ncbi:YqgE/AlgH family protein [Methylotenera mobilis]|jgi:putative transcriptional regulator|uniref:YqgE/AlgH family protein n=1 Tax=Methylotenera mobilis TaxID=359408 RepID=UPI00035FAD75|nr:YqgE/AlgH family protein [Methylotenera mobilis]PPC97733.1 MAG: YqgE/AlgH family protein [Methylotenera sp.]
MSLDNMNLTGHFLIAMPNLTDPYFAKSVTFICTHNQDGAMGIVINRPTDMSYETLFEKINIKLEDTAIANDPVLYGGPVQPERGFVLHEPFGDWDSSITINDKTSLTTSKDILEAVAVGAGPKKLIFSLGYAGWTPNQLEQEIVQNSWLSVQAKDIETLNKILFDTPHEEQLNAAISLLGFDPAMLSDVAGHA